MDIRQAPVDAIVTEGELFMVNTKQVKDRGMDIVAISGILSHFVAPLVGSTIGHSALDTAAGQPIGKAEGIMVPAFAAADEGEQRSPPRIGRGRVAGIVEEAPGRAGDR